MSFASTNSSAKRESDNEAIDLQKLRDRYSVEDYERLLAVFIESVPVEIGKFKTAVQESDVAAISAAIHGLKEFVQEWPQDG